MLELIANTPLLGKSYLCRDGRQLLVWGISYDPIQKTRMVKVMLEYDDGTVSVVDMDEWYLLCKDMQVLSQTMARKS